MIWNDKFLKPQADILKPNWKFSLYMEIQNDKFLKPQKANILTTIGDFIYLFSIWRFRMKKILNHQRKTFLKVSNIDFVSISTKGGI
jgi:hypothetical protein